MLLVILWRIINFVKLLFKKPLIRSALISLGTIIILALFDLFYRQLVFQKLELVSLEFIIFSLVHTIYQVFYHYSHKVRSRWGESFKLIPVIKLIVLFSSLAGGIVLYQSMKEEQDKVIRKCFEELIKEPGITDEKFNKIINIRDTALKIITVDVWRVVPPKEEEREFIVKLVRDAKISDKNFNADSFVIQNRGYYKLLTVILLGVAICSALLPLE